VRTFTQYLKEISLSRVWQHATNERQPFGIMTAFQRGATFADNMTALIRLAYEVHSAGYGYTFLDGHYTYSDTGEPAEERSLFIVGSDSGNLKGALKQWATTYGQESVLFKPTGESAAYLLYASGQMERLGEFHPNRLGAFYSKVRGRPGSFVFEEAYVAKNWLERMGEWVLRGRPKPVGNTGDEISQNLS
jgi:hypothetical protein